MVKALRNSASAASATMAHGPQASLFDAAGLLVRSRSGNELGEGPITVKPTLTETNGSVQFSKDHERLAMSGEPWKLWVTDQPDGAGTTVLTLQFAAVERTTRFTMLLHLPRMTGHGKKARVKNGPALAVTGFYEFFRNELVIQSPSASSNLIPRCRSRPGRQFSIRRNSGSKPIRPSMSRTR